MRRLGTDKLNLNRAWAGTWQRWTCPCCNRTKPQIARRTSSGVLLCALEFHHDHLGDKAGKRFEEIIGKSDDREFMIQRSHAKYGMLQFVERFQRTLICIDCNLAEGKAKGLVGDMDPDFTFSPKEIAGFINAADNRVHEIDGDAVLATWNRVKPDIVDRMDFCERMARRFANGKNRRELAIGTRENLVMNDYLVIWKQVADAVPELSRGNSIATRVLARSTSRDAVHRSTRPKTKPSVMAISDADFAALDAANSDQKFWTRSGDDWTCACCHRTKREICRRSNARKWTARIHKLRDWILDDDNPNALYWRLGVESAGLIIVDHKPTLVCQDCRHVATEVQKLDDSVDYNALTIGDVADSIITIAPNQMHEVDYDFALQRARENGDLVAAVNAYHEHEQEVRFQMDRIKSFTKWHRCSVDEARDNFAYEYAKAVDVDLEEGHAFVNWMIAEGHRFERLRALE